MLSSPNDESPANVEAAVSLTIFLLYVIVLLQPSHPPSSNIVLMFGVLDIFCLSLYSRNPVKYKNKKTRTKAKIGHYKL